MKILITLCHADDLTVISVSFVCLDLFAGIATFEEIMARREPMRRTGWPKVCISVGIFIHLCSIHSTLFSHAYLAIV